MKHPDTSCDRAAVASPLALRWGVLSVARLLSSRSRCCGVGRPADYFHLRLTAASSRVSGAIKSQRAKKALASPTFYVWIGYLAWSVFICSILSVFAIEYDLLPQTPEPSITHGRP